METKKLKITVGPSVILLALLVIAAIILIPKIGQDKGRRPVIDDTPVIATRIRALGELTTACFFDEIVLSDSKQNAFSTSRLGSLARDNFGKDVDDHLVIIAQGTVRAGIDLGEMENDDIRFSGDTVVVRLPSPRYLDILVNPSDFEVFAESGTWTQEQVSKLEDTARQRLISEADATGLKLTAYQGAVDAVTDLMAACGYTFIRFEHPEVSLSLPSREEPQIL